MSDRSGHRFDGGTGAATGLLGVFVVAYGAFVLPQSGLGGAWIASVGLCLLAAVAVGSTWGRRRLGLSPDGSDSVALAFFALAIVLAVAFVAVNGATFTPGEATSESG